MLMVLFPAGRPINRHVWFLHENSSVLQSFGTLPIICFFYGLPAFYCTVLCIVCSQLEQLRAKLLKVKKKSGTSARASGSDSGQEEERGGDCACQALFSHMQKQLNECVSHHQLILK
jgi:hypothetical protein